jgi:hypothetical protein
MSTGHAVFRRNQRSSSRPFGAAPELQTASMTTTTSAKSVRVVTFYAVPPLGVSALEEDNGPFAMIVVAFVMGIVLAPLAREYADLRRSFGLSRVGAIATTSLVFPAFAMSTVLALPFSAHPVAQWLATVATTLVIYSLAARAIAASASRPETAPSRRI